MFTYNEYIKYKKPGVIKLLKKVTSEIKCLAWFYCCCCPTHISEIGEEWKSSLKLYDGIDPEKTDQLFSRALDLLFVIRQRLILEYSKSRCDPTQQINLRDDKWLQFIMKRVLNRALLDSVPLNFPASNYEVQLLIAALPMFYPATINNQYIVVAFGANVDEKIKQCIRLCVE
jgi:hypothetical protein